MNLKKYRIKNKYTQKQIADILGVTKSSYNHYENENRKIDIYKLKSLSELYKINIEKLLIDKEQKNRR